MPSDKLYKTSEIAPLIQMNEATVLRWAKTGLINSYTTPGGHQRIRIADLVVFLRKHGMYIPPDLEQPRRKVLVADDDPTRLQHLRRGMKPFGERIELLTADSAADALLMVGLHRPQVLILESDMEDLDGLTVIAKLKAHAETRSVEVVLVTDELGRFKRRALRLGVKTVLRRSLSPAEVVQLSSR